MSTKANDEETIQRLERELANAHEDYDDLEDEICELRLGLREKIGNACELLFTNDLGHPPGKLVIIDYWGNQVGEWTPETLREFMESRLL